MTSVARKNMLCWVLPLFLLPVLCFSEVQSPPPVPTLEEFLNKAEEAYNRHAELLRHSTGTAHVRVTRSGGEEEATRLADQYQALGFEPPKPPYDKVGNSMTAHWYAKGDQLRYDMDIRALEGISPWTPEAVLRVSTNGKVGVYYAPLDRKAYVNQPPVRSHDLTSYLRYFDPIFPYLEHGNTIYGGLRERAKKQSLYLEYADLNGLSCIRVTASPDITGDKICYISELTCWFGTDQGYALVQLEATRRSYENNVLLKEIVITENVNYEQSLEHPDVWIMKSYRKYQKDYDIQDLSIDFEDVHLGVDVPDVTFNFEGIGVPQGTPIFDRRTSGKSAIYHYVPGVYVGLDRIDLAAGEIPQNPVQDSGCPEGPPAFSQDKSSASSSPISFEEVIDKSEADYLRRVELLKHSTGTAWVKVKRLGGEKLAASLANQYRAMVIEPSELRTTGGNTMEVHWYTKGENLRYDIQIGKLDDMPPWEQEATKRIATNGKVGIYHVPLDGKAYVNRPPSTINGLTGYLDYFEVDRPYRISTRLPFDGMRTMRERGGKVSLETVSIDGVDCVHALCLFPEKKDGSEKKITEIWFAIPYNYAIKRVIGTRTFYKNGLVSYEVLKTYDANYEPSKEYPDLWILKSLRQYAREYYEEELTIDFENVHIGVDVPDATFTFEGIGVLQGTPIFDRRTTGKSVVYHYVPGVYVGLDRIDLAAGEIPQNPVKNSGCPEGPPEKQPGVPPPASAPPH